MIGDTTLEIHCMRYSVTYPTGLEIMFRSQESGAVWTTKYTKRGRLKLDNGVKSAIDKLDFGVI